MRRLRRWRGTETRATNNATADDEEDAPSPARRGLEALARPALWVAAVAYPPARATRAVACALPSPRVKFGCHVTFEIVFCVLLAVGAPTDGALSPEGSRGAEGAVQRPLWLALFVWGVVPLHAPHGSPLPSRRGRLSGPLLLPEASGLALSPEDIRRC